MEGKWKQNFGLDGKGLDRDTWHTLCFPCHVSVSSRARLFSKNEEKRLKVHQLSELLGCLTSVLCSSLSMVKLKAGVELMVPSLWLKILYSLQGKWSESPLDWKVGAVSFLRVTLCISKVWLPLSVKFRCNTQRVSVYLIEAKVD